MGLWSKKKVDPLDLNKGYEWTKDDQVAVEELNAMTNCSLYAQDFVEKLVTNIDVSEAGVVGTPSVTLVDGDGATEGKPYKKFKFANLKGEKGDTGGVAPVVQGTGTATGSVMSQNAVTTELESRAKSDASNLTNENIASWANKLGCENVENVETVYDKDSNDANINWGYTSGFKNISITGKDFSKYKILRAYFTKNESSNANILEVGIRRDISGNIIRSEATQDVDLITTGTNLRSLYIAVESNSSIAFNYIAGNSDYYRNENAYCYKIEGVY